MLKKISKSLGLLGLAMMIFMAVTNAPGSASTSARPAQSFTYNGTHSDWVHKLLTRAGGWQCPANASDSGKAPTVKAEECQRDASVAAAVLYAWAAECYARAQEPSKAQDAAEQMYQSLKSAQDFCSNSPNVGGKTCDTENLYKCGEL